MHAEIAKRKKEIAKLCRSHGVARLELFGSAARGTDFDPATSDADFLVEFHPSRKPETFKDFFAFENALAAAVGRKVDLLAKSPLAFAGKQVPARQHQRMPGGRL